MVDSTKRNVLPLRPITAQQLPTNQRLTHWWLGLSVAAVALVYADVGWWLWGKWSTEADYSHGFLVPIFSAYLVWGNWQRLEPNVAQLKQSGSVFGIFCVALGLMTRVSGMYLGVPSLEGFSMIPFLLGIAWLILDRPGAVLLAPAILFLVFMIPLPSIVAGQLSSGLQQLSTVISTYCLQTLGVPALAEGNVISLSGGQIGVAEACSGLRMLVAFFALTVGCCLLLDRGRLEKLLIVGSAIPIAILVNCARITATGVAYEVVSPHFATSFFHDMAGWLMMPAGLGVLMLGLAALDRLIVTDDALPIGWPRHSH